MGFCRGKRKEEEAIEKAEEVEIVEEKNGKTDKYTQSMETNEDFFHKEFSPTTLC